MTVAEQTRVPRRGAARLAELGALALLAAYALGPLVYMLAHAISLDLVFAGSDGPFPSDQFQYMAWIREYDSHLLASNTLDVAPSDHVFLHPMFLVSGLGLRLGMSIQLAFLLWKPVAIVALFAGFRAYVARFVCERWTRRAALVLALFYAGPALMNFVWNRVDAESNAGKLLTAGGEILPATLPDGYIPAAISVALMPLFLLGVERSARAVEDEAPPRPLLLALVSACGAAVAWLHPWQGEVLLATVGAALGLVALERRRLDMRQAVLALPLAAVLAPILYYFVLSRSDPAWRLAADANEANGHLPVLLVAAGLLPLAIPAALGARRLPRDLGTRMLILWPAAAALVFLVLSPSFPQHALEGVSLPLAVLAVLGLSAVRHPAAVVAGFVAVLVVAGPPYLADWVKGSDDPLGQARYLARGEADALRYLRDDGAPGGVLTRAHLGGYVPAATGRRSWVGHPSWTRDFAERAREAEALFDGLLPPRQAAAVVRSSGVSFVLVDCKRAATAVPAVRPLAVGERHFGCATVFRVNRLS